MWSYINIKYTVKVGTVLFIYSFVPYLLLANANSLAPGLAVSVHQRPWRRYSNGGGDALMLPLTPPAGQGFHLYCNLHKIWWTIYSNNLGDPLTFTLAPP